MLDAIPLYCPNKAKPKHSEVGSGFGYQGKNGLWLITAAHIGLGTKPHEDWSKWAEQIFVVLPGPHTFPISLFDGDIPRFHHMPPVGNNQIKPDVIAVPISKDQWARLASDYRLFNTSDIGQLAPGDGVIGRGYPSVTNGKWPGTMEVFNATAEVYPYRIRFNFEVRSGFSGGPLTDSHGNIVGVLDSGDDQQRGYAWDFNFVQLGSNL